MRRQKSSNVGRGIVGVLLALIIAAAGAVVGVGFGTDWSFKFKNKGGNTQVDGGSTDNGALTLPGGNTEIEAAESNGIMLMVMPMTLNAARDYEIDEAAESVKEVTATIMPENATYKVVDFTIAWNGEQAGKPDISQYITIAQPSDGALKCAITVLQPFAYEAVLTCTARPLVEGDEVPSATCKVNYYRRLSSVSGFVFREYNAGEEVNSFNVASGTMTYSNATYDNVKLQLDFTTSVGSKDLPKTTAEPEIVISLDVKEEYKSELAEILGVSEINKVTRSYHYTDGGMIEDNYLYKFATAIDALFGVDMNTASTELRARVYTYLYQLYSGGNRVFEYEIEISYQSGGISTFTYSMPVLFNPLALGVKPTAIVLPGEIIF